MIESIDEQTRRFASGLTRAVRMITSDAPEFQVSIAGHDSWLATVRPEDDAAVALTAGGRRLLDLTVSYVLNGLGWTATPPESHEPPSSRPPWIARH